MKKVLLMIFGIMYCIALNGQTVMWEKAYNLQYADFADAIESTGQGSYLSLCSSHKYGVVNSYMGVCAVKINSLGDTVFVKDLNVSVGTLKNISMTKDSFGNYWAAVNSWYFDYLVHVLKLDSNGVVLAHYTIDDVSVSAGVLYSSRIKFLPDGDLLIVGQTLGSSVSGMIHDAFVTRMSGTGIVKWTRYYNLGYYTEGYYVEGMANGHYWVSGSAYSDIWGMELDTSGNVVREHIFYSTPTYAKINGAYVQQLPNQKYLVIGGSVWTNPVRRYVGLYDSNYNLVWQQPEQVGNCFPAYITSDTSIVLGAGMMVNNVYNTTLTKYKQNGSVLWSTNFTGGAYPQTKTISSIAFTGDGDAVFAGYIDSPSPAFYDLYFMKVGGIGLPYLPETDSSWLVTSSKPVLSSGAKVSIYPNPARDKVMIESKAGSVIELMSVTGQLLQREVSQSEQTEMSLTSLHTGIYVLKVDGVSHPLSVIH